MRRKIKLLSILAVSVAAIFTASCSKDKEPDVITAQIDIEWNGPELASDDLLQVSEARISDVKFNGEAKATPHIEKVQYFIGNRLIGESSAAPYSVESPIDNFKKGKNTFRVDFVFGTIEGLKVRRAWAEYDLIIQ